MATPKKLLDSKEYEVIELFRKYPDIAAESILVRHGLPLRLSWYQRYDLRKIWHGQFGLLVWARGAGKTTFDAIYAILRSILYPNHKVVIVGGSYRQARHVFNEIANFYYESPILQQSAVKPPSVTPVQCELAWRHNSYIYAFPIGDGNKIRGARGQTLIADETAQIPSDIISTVLMPFLNIKSDVWGGRDDIKNSFLMSTSAYFQFNHVYESYKDYLEKSDPTSDKYDPNYMISIRDIYDIPIEWLDVNVIKHQRHTQTRLKWLMENMAIFPSDSDGWYPASLIYDQARSYDCQVRIKGRENKEYVMGIDPARHGANFAIVIIELGDPHKIVYVETLPPKQKTLQAQALKIRQLTKKFNIVRIDLDSGGGGLHLKDLLKESAEFYNQYTGKWEKYEPILDADDPEFKFMEGSKILHMFKASDKTNTEINYNLLSLFEQGHLVMPKISPDNVEKPESTKFAEENAKVKAFNEIENMCEEIISIEVTPLSTGYYKFDTPTKTKLKDRYSACLLAAWGAKQYYDSMYAPSYETDVTGIGIEGTPWTN